MTSRRDSRLLIQSLDSVDETQTPRMTETAINRHNAINLETPITNSFNTRRTSVSSNASVNENASRLSVMSTDSKMSRSPAPSPTIIDRHLKGTTKEQDFIDQQKKLERVKNIRSQYLSMKHAEGIVSRPDSASSALRSRQMSSSNLNVVFNQGLHDQADQYKTEYHRHSQSNNRQQKAAAMKSRRHSIDVSDRDDELNDQHQMIRFNSRVSLTPKLSDAKANWWEKSHDHKANVEKSNIRRKPRAIRATIE